MSSGSPDWTDLTVSLFKKGASKASAILDDFTTDGNFEFKGLVRGKYEVRFELDGYLPVILDVELDGTNVTDADTVLAEFLSVKGAVTVSGGEANWASLVVMIKDVNGDVVDSVDGFTENGNYEFEAVPYGEGYKVTAQMTGFKPKTTNAFQVKTNVTGKNIELDPVSA